MAVVSILPGAIEMRYPTLSDNGENLVVALGIPVITRKSKNDLSRYFAKKSIATNICQFAKKNTRCIGVKLSRFQSYFVIPSLLERSYCDFSHIRTFWFSSYHRYT